MSTGTSKRGPKKRLFGDAKLGKFFYDLNNSGMTLRDISTRYDTPYDAVREHIKAFKESPEPDVLAPSANLPRLYGPEDVVDGYNEERVERLLDFIRSLRIPSTTAGVPAAPPVVTDEFIGRFIREVYGRSTPDGRRRIRTALLSVPRQNGKSLLAAMLALAHIIGPESIPHSQIVCGATAREQAGVVFRKVVDIVEASGLSREVKVLRPSMRIESLANGVRFGAVPRESRTMQGYSLPFFVCDELAQHHDIDFYNALANSQGSFEEPLGLVISTKSTHPENPMGKLLEYSEAVEHGLIEDDTWYAQVHCVNPGEDWEDEELWRRANPNLGVSPKMEDMQAAYRKAKIVTSERLHFQTYRLNMDVGLSSRLFSAETWRACADTTISLERLEGKVCYGGLDLAEVRDMSAFALYWPEEGVLHTWQWLPAGQLMPLAEDTKMPLVEWARNGTVNLIGDKVQDYGDLAVEIDAICSRFNVIGIAFDPYRMAQLEVKARENSIKLPPLVEVSQTMRHMPPMLEAFERTLYDGRLRHPNNEALNIAATTVEFQQDKSSGSRKPLKPVASKVRIDPIVAAIMAVGLSSRSKRKVTNRFAALQDAL